jgi:ribonuclease HI
VSAVSGGQTEVFVRRENGQYDQYQSNMNNIGQQLFVQRQPRGIVDMVPSHLVPAEMGNQRRNGRQPVQFRPREDRTRELPRQPSTTFVDFVTRQGDHIRQTMEYLDLSDETATKVMNQLYAARQVVAGTDGGLLNYDGTLGYVWANPDDNAALASGQGKKVPGQLVSMSSTRTKMLGLFVALTHVRLVIEYFHMVTSHDGFTATVYCDSKASLQRVQDIEFDEFGTTWQCRANNDIEAAIRTCIQQQLGVHIHWKWVKGHASRRKRPENFTMAETLNEAADSLATAARSNPRQAQHTHCRNKKLVLSDHTAE